MPLTEEVFRFADDLGPSKIVHVYEPTLGLKAVPVIDNAAPGPSIGLRMAPDVSTTECFRLACAMRAVRKGLRRPGRENLRVVKEVANAASVFREVMRVTHDHPYQAIIDAANTKNAI